MAKHLGRQTVCTPEMIEAIANAIILGAGFEAACVANDISERAGYYWMERARLELERQEQGQPADPSKAIYVQFFQAMQSAIPRRQINLLAAIDEAILGGKEYTETREEYETKILPDGTIKEVLTKKVIITRQQAPSWQAASAKLERLHPELYSRRLQVTSWEQELTTLYQAKQITEADIIELLGPELAAQFLTGLQGQEALLIEGEATNA